MRGALERIVDDVSPTALRPNIVLILTDDQRADTLGYMPATFERLAGQGLVFRNAFATTPSCSPSRVSIYTGLLARRHGVTGNGLEPLFDPTDTIATTLSAAGYVNGFFGKYLNGAEELGLPPPPGWNDWNVFLRSSGGSYFDSQLNENGVVRTLPGGQYSTDVMGRRAVEFIRRNAAEQFFVVYAPYAPHSPSLPAPRHDGVFAGLPFHRPPSWREKDLSLKPDWVRVFSAILGPDEGRSRDRHRLKELETLLAVDDSVREITDTLERMGLTDETLVVFASDHGIQWGEHWTGTKFAAYEESIRMPLVMRYPARVPLPRSVDELVANIDVAPTLAELAHTRLRREVDGESLVPFVQAAAPRSVEWRTFVPIESGGGLITKPNRALRTVRWKYIETGVAAGITTELYDLDADRYELHNLAFDPDFREIRDALADRLDVVLPE